MLNLDQAVELSRSIQRDLDAGKLKVPYPPDVRAQLVECCAVFNANGNETAGELVRRLQAPEPAKTLALPW